MAGLQAQVKHIEDINEEMMGDSFRYDILDLSFHCWVM